MMRIYPLGAVALVFALASCSQVSGLLDRGGSPASPSSASTGPAPDGTAVPDAAPPTTTEEVAAVVSAPRPSAAARTVAELDTTTDAQKAAARAEPATEGRSLGEVTASLGDPTEPGLWMTTALVGAVQPGRVVVKSTGESGLVELRPLGGDGGASLSLAAMQLLGVSLIDIPTVVVYAQ